MAYVIGTSGDDVLAGGEGDDTIRSGAGNDSMDGGAGFDTYVLNLGRSSFVVTSPAEGVLVIRPSPGGLGAGFGTDTASGVESFRIVSSNGTVTVPASEMLARFNFGYAHAPTEGDDKLLGGPGADDLHGLGGDDTMEGGAGDDSLNGGAGANVLVGGEGADVFVFDAGGGGRDRINDFRVGVDRVVVNPADGYRPWAEDGGDGLGGYGTWLVYGRGEDAVFLPGVSRVALDALLA